MGEARHLTEADLMTQLADVELGQLREHIAELKRLVQVTSKGVRTAGGEVGSFAAACGLGPNVGRIAQELAGALTAARKADADVARAELNLAQTVAAKAGQIRKTVELRSTVLAVD